MKTAMGELTLSERMPNALSIQFGRNTNATSSQDYLDRPMAEKGAKFHIIDEIHVDAHFDIVQNKGYWLNGNNEKQEINDSDWYNPEPEAEIVLIQQPYNPNLLAITTGVGDGWQEGWSYKKFLIRKVITIHDVGHFLHRLTLKKWLRTFTWTVREWIGGWRIRGKI